MRRLLFVLSIALLLPLSASAQDTLVVRGHLHTGDGTSHADGGVVIVKGKVVAAGAWDGLTVPGGAKVVALPGTHITPGLIDASSTAGLVNPYDWSEQKSEIVPHLQVIDEIDLSSGSFKRLVKRGITTVYVAGGPSSVIGSQGTVLKTAGKQRVLRKAGGIKATLGPETWIRGSFNRRPFSGKAAPRPKHSWVFRSVKALEHIDCCGSGLEPRFGSRVSHTTRRPTTFMGNVWVFREAFAKAQLGAKDKASAILRQVIAGKASLRIQARRRGNIETAIRLAREFKLRFVLEEGTECYYLLDALAKYKVPVIYGPIFEKARSVYRSMSGEGKDPCLSTATQLAAKGIPFCLTANDRAGEDDLWGQAMLAIRYGLTSAQAVQAVTASPATILGQDVAARVGRLAKGLDADLVVWSGKPFAATTKPVAVLIDGGVVAGSLSKTKTKAGAVKKPGRLRRVPKRPRRQFRPGTK